MTKEKIISAIQAGSTTLGIELGSTRIKAVLIDENHEVLKVGLLNLGNVNLNISLNNVIARYAYVLKQVRGISVPNCGNWKNWNKKLLSVFAGVDIQYVNMDTLFFVFVMHRFERKIIFVLCVMAHARTGTVRVNFEIIIGISVMVHSG